MRTRYCFIHEGEYDSGGDDRALDRLLSQIFPDPEVLDYMLCFLGSCLSGRVHEELIHFWTGLSNKQTGSNGKSTFVSLLLHTFGDYAACGHSSIITSKRESASSPNSAIIDLKRKRLVTFQEIDNENSINMPVIKAMTGNDMVTGRQLYKTQESFLPQWKLIVCANKLPPVSSDDGGTQRRLRNVPFESKFVGNPNDPKWRGMPNVFAIDYHLKSKLERYRLPMMHRLLDGYQRYVQLGELPVCEKIMAHTKSYFRQQNALYQFLIAHLTPKTNHRLAMRDLLTRYSFYNNSNTKPTLEEFLDTFHEYFPDTELIHEPSNNGWYVLGYTFVASEDALEI
jgi:P4 family phage/plasmid primase-like protien